MEVTGTRWNAIHPTVAYTFNFQSEAQWHGTRSSAYHPLKTNDSIFRLGLWLSWLGSAPMILASTLTRQRDTTVMMVIFGLCVMLAGCAIWAYQGLLWLRAGSWEPITLGLVLTRFDAVPSPFEWHGVGIIVGWVLDQSLGGWCSSWGCSRCSCRVNRRILVISGQCHGRGASGQRSRGCCLF